MKIINLGTPTELAPGANNPRNSEGSFLTLPDGRIAIAYSRYTGDSSEDDAECEVVCIYSNDGGESFDTENIQTLVSGAEYGVKNVMSVTLRYMDNGDIGLFYVCPAGAVCYFASLYGGTYRLYEIGHCADEESEE